MSCILIYVLSLLCPCRIVPRYIYFVYYALVECWAYKYLALCLLACMSYYLFQVWMSTVITTLWWLLGWSSHGLFLNSIFAWSHIACFICISYFSSYNDHGVLLCFRRFMFIWFKNFTVSRFRCEWVLPLFSNSRLSLESVLGCFVME